MNKPRAPNAGNAGLHEAWWNRDERGCRRSGNSDWAFLSTRGFMRPREPQRR